MIVFLEGDHYHNHVCRLPAKMTDTGVADSKPKTRHIQPKEIVMNRQNRLWMGVVVGCVSMMGLGGCAETPVPSTRTDTPIQNVEGVPLWVVKKGQAFSGERAALYGVGNAAALQNPSLRRKAAEGAAMRDLAQTLQVYVAGLQKQYLAETTAGAMDRHSVEQHIEDVMKTVTQASLNGVTIVEYWENPTRNEAFALARLDPARFVEAMQAFKAAGAQYKELDEKMRDFVRKNAEKAMEELNQATAPK